MVSVLIALTLVVACGVFVVVRYLYGGESGAETDPIEQISELPPVTPTVSQYTPTPTPTEQSPTPPEKTPAVKVRGIYVDTWTAVAHIDRFIEICNTSEINTIVIDIKDEHGYITFIGNEERILPTSMDVIRDATQFVSRLKENGIYTIARLVCFKDRLGAERNPEMAILDSNGVLWRDGSSNGGMPWLNPYNPASWEYLAAVAKETAQLGFDEIQLDYVRFPADGNLDAINFGSAAIGKSKAEAIGEFLEYMQAELADTRARLSADIFGIIMLAEGDFEGIGQDFDIIIQNVDSVCPMIYPSHFANEKVNGRGQIINGTLFTRPDLEPYDVVLNTLLMAYDRLPEDGEHAVVRPYLQAFTADYLGNGYFIPYTEAEILEQIQAVYDAGFDEWIMWNHSAVYDVYEDTAALLPMNTPVR